MGGDCLTVSKAWDVYDRWLRDPKVEIHSESSEVDALFRQATQHFAKLSSPKVLGDCYLVAVSRALQSTLVTLDSALAHFARQIGHKALLLAA